MLHLLGYANEAHIARDNKKISFIEERENKPKLVQYDCKIKEEVSIQDIHSFYQFLYSMKLDSNLSGSTPLRKGKITLDLIQQFNQLLTSDDKKIDFSGILSLLSSEELTKTSVVQEPIRKFLDLFEISNKEEFPIQDYIVMAVFSHHPNFIGTEESREAESLVNAIDGNTKILKHTLLQETKLSSKEEVEKNAVKQKRIPITSTQAAKKVG